MAIVLFSKFLDLIEEADESPIDVVGAHCKFGLVDRLESQSIEHLTRSRTDNDTNPCYDSVSNMAQAGEQDKHGKRTLEAEICKQGDVLGSLLALGQLGEDQESSPTLARA